MKILVRIYVPQGDKINVFRDNLEDAVKLLGVSLDDTKQRLKWCNCEDIYFKGTNNYIRIIN